MSLRAMSSPRRQEGSGCDSHYHIFFSAVIGSAPVCRRGGHAYTHRLRTSCAWPRIALLGRSQLDLPSHVSAICILPGCRAIPYLGWFQPCHVLATDLVHAVALDYTVTAENPPSCSPNLYRSTLLPLWNDSAPENNEECLSFQKPTLISLGRRGQMSQSDTLSLTLFDVLSSTVLILPITFCPGNTSSPLIL